MAITETYFDPDLATGLNDGTSEANAWQTWTQMQTDHVAGERVNAKNPTSPYQPGANIAFAVSATDLLVSIFRGYGSTIGDGTKFEMDLETANTLTITGEASLVLDIDVTGGDISILVSITGDMASIENFSIVNTGTSTNSHTALNLNDANAVNGYIENNSTTATASDGHAVVMTRSTLSNCEITSTRIGVENQTSSRAGSVVDCLIYEKGSSGTRGYYVTGLTANAGGVNKRLTIDGFTNSIYLLVMDDVATGTTPWILQDSILSNSSVGVFNTDTATKNMAADLTSIAFYNCTTDTQLGDNEVQNKISLTADPYTNAGINDYSLNNTAGGGADCRGAAKFGGA